MTYVISNDGTFEPAPVLIVGEAPGRNDDPAQPLTGPSGRRLAGLVTPLRAENTLPRRYLCCFDRANLLDEWPGRVASGTGDAFPSEQARRNALAMALDGVFARYRRVILLGRRVPKAMEHGPNEWFEWYKLADSGPHFATIPHPSGLNRWWNDDANVAEAQEFMRTTHHWAAYVSARA